MNPSILLNKPKPKITPKITKIKNLAQSAEEIKKTSSKLRKTFEKGTYQKKTQLSILNRYKKRLDSIQKQNDKRFLKKQRVKIKLPEIKKFSGSLFSAGSGNDPLKSIAALAGFNALRKGLSGDVLGAIGPALVFAGLTFGPSLLKGGVGLLKSGKSQPQATTSTGKAFFGPSRSKTVFGPSRSKTVFGGITSKLGRIGSPTGKPGIRAQIGLAARQFEAGAFRQTAGAKAAFPIALPGTPSTAERLGGAAQNIANKFGTKGVGDVAETIATSKPSMSPRVGLLNAALFGLDYMGRKSEGQTNLQAGVGAGAGVGGALIGAAIGSALFPGVGTLAGFLIGAAFSTGGALIASKLADTITGAGKPEQDRLKKQTEQQKKLVEKKKDEGRDLTFGKSLDRYEKVVNKFSEFAKNFRGAMGMGGEQTGVVETGNRAVPTGVELQDLEATGGEVPGSPDSPYGPRWGRMHQGNDYSKPVGTPISVVQPGTVTVADMNYDPTGWGAVVEIRHSDGSLSRYAHLSKINVSPGSEVVPGQVIGLTGGAAGAPGSGNSQGPHLHFEYENSSGRVDPTSVAPKIFRFGGNVRVKQTGQQASKSSTTAQSFQGSGGYGRYSFPSAQVSTPQVSTPSRPARGIQYYPSYDSRGKMDQVIPVTVPIPQQQMSQGQVSSPMMMGRPSEQQVLNSFYKRVLLNTVA